MRKKIVAMTLVFTFMVSQMVTVQATSVMEVIETLRFLAMPICQDTDIAVLEELRQVSPAFFPITSSERNRREREVLEDFHKRQKEYHTKHFNADTEQEPVSSPQPQTVWQRIKAKTKDTRGT
ncbi:MAG: hypothetical protein LBS61_00200 [Endomicrobium sp.]|jgi:hypothetical protein|nr:hypothetical protein [Endomicrobium sp.]